MPVTVAPPIDFEPTANGCIVTLVLPANSCQLDCAWCYLKGSKETQNQKLSVSDYLKFIDHLATNRKVDIITIQGYEPLEPSSWHYTKSVIDKAHELNVPVSMVTNGYFLKERAKDLKQLFTANDSIYVSIDASTAEHHDQNRGTNSFDKAIDGIKTCVDLGLKDQLYVSSVLQPNKIFYLVGMPRLLKSLDISVWVISPLRKISSKNFGQTISENSLPNTLSTLQSRAKQEGIQFIVDDELNEIRALDGFSGQVRRYPTPENIYRLAPNGELRIANQIVPSQVINIR